MKRPSVIVLSALIGVLALALLFLGYLGSPRHALFSYLTVYLYVLTLALGSLVLLFIGHVTRARWFVVMRRAPETVSALFPLLALLALPLLVQLPVLYPWAGPLAELPHHVKEAVHEKRGYLNVPFFLVRALAYLAFWTVAAELLRAWSRRQDNDADPRLASRQRTLSAALLPGFAFTLTFASFDWLMSLTPAWYSNALGFYLFTGCFVAGLALLIILGERARFSLGLARDSERSLFHVAGKLLLVAVILWAYIAFAQFFLIWITDLPEEVSWYSPRMQGEWGAVALVLVVTHFALPFLALLSKPLKRRPRVLAAIALWLLVAHFIDLYWLVFPTLHPDGLYLDWMTPLALVGVGGLSLAFSALRARGAALVPRRDPLLQAGLEYRTR